jgi:hypothetical protein
VPASTHDLGAQVAELFPSECGWPPPAFVLDLPCLLVHVVSAPEAEVHFRVIAEVDHAVGGVAGAATPALNVSIVTQADCRYDRFSAHTFSLRARSNPGKYLRHNFSADGVHEPVRHDGDDHHEGDLPDGVQPGAVVGGSVRPLVRPEEVIDALTPDAHDPAA